MLAYCDTCGAEINRVPSQLSRYPLGKNFCSRKCLIDYQRKIELDRFRALIETTNSCWLWRGKLNHDGYGLFYACGGVEVAHRASWRLLVGHIPVGMKVLHNCPGGDNRACVNPTHLFIGTQTDNVYDAIKKGTHISVLRSGI